MSKKASNPPPPRSAPVRRGINEGANVNPPPPSCVKPKPPPAPPKPRK